MLGKIVSIFAKFTKKKEKSSRIVFFSFFDMVLKFHHFIISLLNT